MILNVPFCVGESSSRQKPRGNCHELFAIDTDKLIDYICKEAERQKICGMQIQQKHGATTRKRSQTRPFLPADLEAEGGVAGVGTTVAERRAIGPASVVPRSKRERRQHKSHRHHRARKLRQ